MPKALLCVAIVGRPVARTRLLHCRRGGAMCSLAAVSMPRGAARARHCATMRPGRGLGFALTTADPLARYDVRRLESSFAVAAAAATCPYRLQFKNFVATNEKQPRSAVSNAQASCVWVCARQKRSTCSRLSLG